MTSTEADISFLTPDGIRRIRGDRSRAAFARELGVTRLTVYRWELPEDAPESRRPRRAMRARLAALAGQAPGPSPGSAVPRGEGPLPEVARPRPAPPATDTGEDIDIEEQDRLLPIMEAVDQCRFQDATESLIHLLRPGVLCSASARALAQLSFATVQLFAHNDVRGAFNTLHSILLSAGEGTLPEALSPRTHALAAGIFASADGHLFDPGRVNAHVQRGLRLLPEQGAEDLRCLLRVGELRAAFHRGDRPMVLQLYRHHEKEIHQARSPLTRCVSEEVRALTAYLGGRVVEAARHFEELCSLARQTGFGAVLRRALAHRAFLKLDAVEDPAEVLQLVDEARRITASAPLQPGVDDVLLCGVHAEALGRLGRFDDVNRVLQEGLEKSARLAWPPVDLLHALARHTVHRGRTEELRQALDLFRKRRAPSPGTLVESCLRFLEGLGSIAEGRLEEAGEEMTAAARTLRPAGVPPWLEPYAAVLGFQVCVMSGDQGRVEAVRAEAERALERAPSAWLSTLLGIFQGILHAQRGLPREAAQFIGTALSVLEQGGDLVQAALARRGLAIASYVMKEKGALVRLKETEEALTGFGVILPPGMRLPSLKKMRERARKVPSASRPAGLNISSLVVPIERLTRRGVAPSALSRDLVAVGLEVLREGTHSLSLAEIDSRGNSFPIDDSGGGGDVAPAMTVDFSDGCGRRFRLTVLGPLSLEEKSAVRVLARVAGLALEVASLRDLTESHAPLHGSPGSSDLQGVIAVSEPMQRLTDEIVRLARSRATVLITGESGTGKEVLAEAVHRHSARSSKPFVTFNCSAVPHELFEGQLFGYVKGAFTGATRNHPGVIRSAQGGTLFLDEIGDLPAPLQPKLLRFLESGEVLPLGATRPSVVDVRVLAATHQDLERMLREGRFREDLYYRLQVISLHIPPLRERRNDIIPLARHFIERLTAEGDRPPYLSPQAVSTLVAHDWPGNVRELRNTVERALAYSPVPTVLSVEHLHLS